MIYFNCDYNEGAHPRIMERLLETNMEQTDGYGCDIYCEKARKLIREKCNAPKAAVHFLVGGTQANSTVIKSVLRPHQGVIAAHTGHIAVHETGAIEAGGHKVLALEGTAGKITAKQIDDCYKAHVNDDSFEHMVQPGMVYISQPTELGTLYSLEELTAISQVCHSNKLILFVDGARLGYGLMAEDNDVSMADLAALCDVFYIGGTKVGALFGEAVVICNPAIQNDFRYIIKQMGGMLAKGRLLGVQFATLFENDLYMEISGHAIELAEQIRAQLYALKVPFLVESHTNQIFPILPDAVLEKLQENYIYCYQERVDENHSAVRFCTSWATKESDVEALCRDLENIYEGEI